MSAPDFKQMQFAFTAHIRNPQLAQKPADIEERRMKIYRELIYNNIEGFVSSSFPVLKQLYTEEHWHVMIRDFFIKHRSESPYFLKIAEEFISYLQNEHETQVYDPKFLLELAHYEWIELALSISEEEINLEGIDPNGDFLTNHPALSPLAVPLAYQFPVHTIGPDNIPDSAPDNPTYLVVYRDRQYEIQFMEINAVTARLLHLLQNDNEISGATALNQIASELQMDADIILNAGHDALMELQKQGILLGVSAN